MPTHNNQIVKIPIVPPVVSYYTLPGEAKLDYRAICCFAALGFFLDDDTYYANQKAFRPANEYQFDAFGNVISRDRYFRWYYRPREISFDQTLSEFSDLLEKIVESETINQRIVLPISGGLDSRTLAAAVSHRKDVFCYSYQFQGGPSENSYGAAVAASLSFPHQAFTLPSGYLWKVIDQLAKLNGCYAEFLNPRQMAVYGQLARRGDIFLLGHGGDLFLDGMGQKDSMTEAEQHRYLIKRLIKPAGLQLAESLWEHWGMGGEFKEYLNTRILELLRRIEIDNANARLRAFKTEYYVARWTAVNLGLFKEQLPISVPFFHDDMCRWICTTQEAHLKGRRLEIEYLKKKCSPLARIPWQKVYPCNLYNYHEFDSLEIKIHRAWIKGTRELRKRLFGNQADAGNWELQFLGVENSNYLRGHLMDLINPEFIPQEIISKYLNEFHRQAKTYVHAITMLLTLQMFQKHFYNGRNGLA